MPAFASPGPVLRFWQKHQLARHLILLTGVLVMALPIWMLFATSTHAPSTLVRDGLQWLPGDQLLENYSRTLLQERGFRMQVTVPNMLLNSLILGVGFAVGKLLFSMAAAYAIVYFRFPGATLCFWVIFTTLLFPLEARIIPSYQVVSNLGLLDSYVGLILPLIASAAGTFFFRQFYRSLPEELLEAAQLDGAGPWKFFKDILVPLSRTMMAALVIIMFVVGWNQYLWPLMMTTSEGFTTLMLAIRNARGHQAFVLAMFALLPPLLVVILFQRWFIKGLVEVYK
ncbi:MAG: ABC transporter permease subunit [bacterium]|jgi:sn-glycerol 3-phosphate transport system permease protein